MARETTSRLLTALALAAGLALIAGCTGADPQTDISAPAAEPSESAGGATGSLVDAREPWMSEPDGLHGVWLIEEAAGEEAGATLTIGADEMQLERECGSLTASWDAALNQLVSHRSHAGGACAQSLLDDPIDWLDAAEGYLADDLYGVPTAEARIDPDERVEAWRLLDRGGLSVALLTRQGEPAHAEPDARESDPAPLPEGLAPALGGDLIGEWVPEGAGESGSELRIDGDRRFTSSDGCNGAAGSVASLRGGRLLVAAGPVTLVACEGVSAGAALATAGRAGLDPATDELVLVDPEGTETLRLTRT
ncbi:MAG: hypothetical protein ABW249_08620 [Solirubrobacterales bacterium]